MTDEQNTPEPADAGAALELAAELEAARLEAQEALELAAQEAERADAAEAKAAAAEAKAETLSPTIDVTHRMYSTAEQALEKVPEDQLRDIAATELAEMNRGRQSKGHFPITWSDKEWAEGIQRAAESLATDSSGHVALEGPLGRVLKMVNPRNGTVVQVPIEDQVNNHRGSLRDSVARYTDKGFKIAVVVLDAGTDDERIARFCATMNCWSPASVDRGSNDLLGGYCTEDHRDRTEAGKRRETASV